MVSVIRGRGSKNGLFVGVTFRGADTNNVNNNYLLLITCGRILQKIGQKELTDCI